MIHGWLLWAAAAAAGADAPAPTNAPPPNLVTNAVEYARLEWRGERYCLAGRPFTGVAEQRDKAGRLKARYSYLEGELHGRIEEWHPNGQPSTETWFERNQRHGTNTYWDADGRLLKRQGWDRDRLVWSTDPHDLEPPPSSSP